MYGQGGPYQQPQQYGQPGYQQPVYQQSYGSQQQQPFPPQQPHAQQQQPWGAPSSYQHQQQAPFPQQQQQYHMSSFAPQQQQPYGAPPPPQAGYGQPSYGGGGFAAPPPPLQQQQQHVPRNYLGTMIAPTEHPLLPSHLRPSRADDQSAYQLVGCPAYDASSDVQAIRKATKGFGTNEAQLIRVLTGASLPPQLQHGAMPENVRLAALSSAYKRTHAQELDELLKKELRSYTELTLRALARGSLRSDVLFLETACKGLGTNEDLLTELVVMRKPDELECLRKAFQNEHTGKNFDAYILSELSMKTKSAFTFALLGEWRDAPQMGRGPLYDDDTAIGNVIPVNEHMLTEDVEALRMAIDPTNGRCNQDVVSGIIFTRSPVHLGELQRRYHTRTRAPLTRHLKLSTDGHLRQAYLYALESGKKDVHGIRRDAKRLRDAMAGAGTKDTLLCARVIRLHWNKQRFQAVKQAFVEIEKGRTLEQAVMRETSGHQRDALLAVIAMA